MDYIIGVSWPRSGHHMLVRLLELYLGDRFQYCEFYGPTDCCKQVPCRRAGSINLSKNHDFDLSVPQLKDRKYLIQYRNFLYSIISEYEVYTWRGGEDSPLAFRKFASARFSRYLLFMNKWVNSDFGRAQLMIRYEDMLESPTDHLEKALRWLDPDSRIDKSRLVEVVATVNGEKIENHKVTKLVKSGVHANRDISQFRHYTPTLIEQIRNLKLPREPVIETFVELLGRPPREGNVLGFQGFDSVDAFATFLRESPEYQSSKA